MQPMGCGMRPVTPGEGPPGGGILMEALMASGAAMLASYVRAKGEPEPWTLRRWGVVLAESVVCGFLAVAAATATGWADPRISAGLGAAFGLVGTAALSDLIVRLMQSRAGKS